MEIVQSFSNIVDTEVIMAGRRRKRKGKAFNPTHEQLDQAVEAFLNKGGEIRKINDISKRCDEFVSNFKSTVLADSFLMDSSVS